MKATVKANQTQNTVHNRYLSCISLTSPKTGRPQTMDSQLNLFIKAVTVPAPPGPGISKCMSSGSDISCSRFDPSPKKPLPTCESPPAGAQGKGSSLLPPRLETSAAPTRLHPVEGPAERGCHVGAGDLTRGTGSRRAVSALAQRPIPRRLGTPETLARTAPRSAACPPSGDPQEQCSRERCPGNFPRSHLFPTDAQLSWLLVPNSLLKINGNASGGWVPGFPLKPVSHTQKPPMWRRAFLPFKSCIVS